MKRGAQKIRRAAVQGDAVAFRARPAKARAGQGEAGQAGQDGHLRRVEALQQLYADAEMQGIAAGQDRRRVPAPRLDARQGLCEGAWPGDPFAPVLRQHRQMAATAGNNLGLIEQGARRRRQAGKAVFADADYAEPGFRRHFNPPARRRCRSLRQRPERIRPCARAE